MAAEVQAHVDEEGLLLCTVAGEIDVASDLHELDELAVGRTVVVDASRVTFAGSSFLAWLLGTKQRCEALRLRQPSPAVLRLIDVAQLTHEFPVDDD